MAIELICSCKRPLRLPEAAAGRYTRCPVCGRTLLVPRPAANSAATPQRRRQPLWPWFVGAGAVLVAAAVPLVIGAARILSAPQAPPESAVSSAPGQPSPAGDAPPPASTTKIANEGKLLLPEQPLPQGSKLLFGEVRPEELDLELLLKPTVPDLPQLPQLIPPRPRELPVFVSQTPQSGPAMKPLSHQELAIYDLVVERFILYDIGRLRGLAGQKALADFNSLGIEALPALIKGLNRAVTMDASCPAIVIGAKIRALLETTDNTELVYMIRENIGKGVSRAVHAGVVQSLRASCDNRIRAILRDEKRIKFTQLGTLMEALKAPDAQIRRDAAILIGLRGAEARDAVPALIAALKDPNAEVRGQAARALVEIGPEVIPAVIEAMKDEKIRGLAQMIVNEHWPVSQGAIPDLIASLKDTEPEVRVVAMHALIRMGPAAVPALIAALQDKERVGDAALILGHIGAKADKAVPALAGILKHPNKEVRLTAHQALVRIGAAAVPALVPLLKDPDPKTGYSAAVALGKIGPAAAQAVPALVKVLEGLDRSYRILAVDALLKIDPQHPALGPALGEAVPLVVDVLGHSDKTLRFWAAECLGKIGPRAAPAVAALTAALRDPDAAVRCQTSLALGQIGAAAVPAVPGLVRLLQDPALPARSQAAVALGRIGPAARAAIPALIAALEQTAPEVRTAVTLALVQMGPAAVPALIAAFRETQPAVRSGSVEALAKIGNPALSALLRTLKDNEAAVRVLAIQSLQQMGPTAREAIPTLLTVLTDPDPQVRLHVILSLGAIDPQAPAVLEALRPCLTDASAAVGDAAQQALVKAGPAAVPVLLTSLKDENARTRRQAVETLRQLGPAAKEAVPVLLGAGKDRDTQVRVSILNALRDIDPANPGAQEAFLQGYQDSDEEVHIAADLALVKLGKAAVPILTKALARSEVRIRRGAVETLKKISTELQEGRAEIIAAAPALIGALRDTDREVREGAAWALGELDAELKGIVPDLTKAIGSARPAATGKDRLGDTDLRFTPVAELLEAAVTQRGPRLRQILTELEQRRGNPVLVTLGLAAVHEEAEVRQLAANLLPRYLAHKPTAKEQQQAATKLHLHKLLAQSGKVERARDRYRELILECPRTSAAEEARRLLAGRE